MVILLPDKSSSGTEDRSEDQVESMAFAPGRM